MVIKHTSNIYIKGYDGSGEVRVLSFIFDLLTIAKKKNASDTKLIIDTISSSKEDSIAGINTSILDTIA